jgi:cellobiose phosphorylase
VPHISILRCVHSRESANQVSLSLATAASDTKIAIQGLLFRLRWSKVYEEGIMNGETAADAKMMTINQERFEDDPTPDSQNP